MLAMSDGLESILQDSMFMSINGTSWAVLIRNKSDFWFINTMFVTNVPQRHTCRPIEHQMLEAAAHLVVMVLHPGGPCLRTVHAGGARLPAPEGRCLPSERRWGRPRGPS